MYFIFVSLQAYFQRVLAVKVPWHAKWLCIAAGIGCLILATPAALLGVVAKCTGGLCS